MGLISKEMIADLVINLINIVILVILVRVLLYKPVKKFLDARKDKIKAAEDEAASREAEALQSKEKYDALISDAEKIKEQTEAEARKNARAMSDSIIGKANEDAEKLLENARAKAQKEHDDMIANAKDELAEIALEMAEKVLGREVTDADNKRIIESFFGKKKQDV
ncbi:MAG: ATP synthase F0 subunit B [Clostridia bacterium]|nr:ATP synthase F0 subunit B [Clostridia bacterium]